MQSGQGRRIAAVIACMAVSGTLIAAMAVQARAAVAVPSPRRAWVRNTRSVPRLPKGSRALHQVDPATSVRADVVLKPRDPAALAAFDTAVSTPGSPSFRHYLAPGQFASVFGPSPATISSTRGWLSGRGLAVGPTSGDGLIVPVSGSATQVDQAFDVDLEQYRLPSGRVVRAPDAEPLVPAALAADLYGVAGLDDLSRPVPQLVRTAATPPGVSAAAVGAVSAPDPHAGGPQPTAGCENTIQSDNGSAGGLTVDQLASAYSFSSLYPSNEGSGVTVGIYELEPFLQSDITTFKNCYSPAISASVSGIGVDRTSPNSGPGQGEAALDIEMVIGMAPAVSAKVYVGPNGGTGPLDTYLAMVDGNNPPQVISTSWGQCEAQLSSAYIQAESAIFEQAVAQGQTITAASGDAGSEDCYFFPSSTDTRLQVDDPAGQPWVTSVGGTTLDAIGPAPTESAWNTGLFSGTGGGGSSTVWTMPAWQRGPGVQSVDTKSRDTFTGAGPCPVSSGAGTVSCREVPDVAADADPRTGLAIFCSCVGGGWAKIGGTSMSAPLWAALAALADQGQSSTVGFVNPALYQAQCAASPVFNDVTVGNNQPLGSSPSNPPRLPAGPYYQATPGYDLATGLGTPIAAALVSRLRAPPPSTCPVVTGISTSSGPASGGTTVTVSGSNLSGVTEVDFANGNVAAITSVSSTSVTVVTPPSPTRGWATSDVIVKAGDDALGFDGSMPFTYLGPRGYWTVASDGGIFSFGQMGFYGSMGNKRLAKPIVGMAPTPSSKGYWEVASDGGIFAFGDAGFYGSTGNLRLVKPIVGMASTPDGGGYWLVASDGGIFAYGDAGFYGSTGNIKLDKPIVGMATTPDGGGYWLVASDGGIFAFGDAAFYGSTGAIKLDKPVVGMAATPDGGGYWLVASDGGIFAFGDAAFHGSTGNIRLTKPVVGMAATPDGTGYWLVASDGGIFSFGGTYGGFYGSTGNIRLTKPMVGIGAP
jgi:Pro-kumamolisin, activation domain/IPT/TIG domain